MMGRWNADYRAWAGLMVAMAITVLAYWNGLHGGFVFDDFPNIVDNKGVQPEHATFGTLVNAALSSPSSDFKRPLASLSFAANYLATGLDPFWMKLTNLVFHLVNGILVFLLTVRLLGAVDVHSNGSLPRWRDRQGMVAVLVAAAWMLLPINLTAVLYTVQRMESMANAFVLLGLLMYIAARSRMLRTAKPDHDSTPRQGGFVLACFALTFPTAIGILAKETAAMLPLYALLVEWVIFGFRRSTPTMAFPMRDWRILVLFALVLVLPMVVGLAILVPNILKPSTWMMRDFTLGQRLLSESRIVIDYGRWIFAPQSHDLSFYHDDFVISTGLFLPWTTAASIILLGIMLAGALVVRKRWPLVCLGLLFFIASHLMTATIIPLELIYEHRNYFSSFGALLVVVPGLSALLPTGGQFVMARRVALGALMLIWGGTTWLTANAWSSPISLARELAIRAPNSPRAQYELGRTYIIASGYQPSSPFTKLVYPALEYAARLPGSSILPEQALVFFNSRMKLPLEQNWWDSMVDKLRTHRPTIQDESSLIALVQCDSDDRCDLPAAPMTRAFTAALAHPVPSARLLSAYADFLWMSSNDAYLALDYARKAADAAPMEPAYHITLGRWAVSLGDAEEAARQLQALRRLNYGGRLDGEVATLSHGIEHIHDSDKQPIDDE
jgi:hypothetical protein